VPCEAPEEGSEELDEVELVEPDCVLDVESLDVEPDWVESVLVEDSVPVADVVELVDVARVPPAAVPLPFAASLGAAPPRLSVVEIPPVAGGVTLTVTVVVVVDLVRAVGEADALAGVWVELPGSAASCECAAGLTAGADTAGASLL
jgi:hypothetical protein